MENIEKHKLVNQFGESYKDFRKKLQPNYFIVWRDIALGYILLGMTLFFSIQIEYHYSYLWALLWLPLLAFFIGFWFSFLQLFIHEASHFNLHPDQSLNDKLTNCLIGIWVGSDIESYRRIHYKHHQSLGHTDDTEHSYFNHLSVRFLFETLFGIHAVRILLHRKAVAQKSTTDTPKAKGKSLFLLLGLSLHGILLLMLLYNGFYVSILAWVMGIGMFFPFFATVRQLLEHRDEHADPKVDYNKVDHGEVNRIFKKTPFSFFFGGAGFDKHLIHHWDPSVSYTRLQDVEDFLLQTEVAKELIIKSKTSYSTTFLKLLK